ncbi:hypothetical protein RB623_06035 [Mesorhizobium sp. LHD-90]|uniref:hypothetical protein n=1 Tax=Mesorhizobium sp. LHD-90 TaxID=3071414 RepID=UPI0027E05D84|nr:hypothetical protein [Mesorhizobium sp. LHD-90]MDQ6433609.1 hypothetical protein [Mesorhizobium sp. LHD-90]
MASAADLSGRVAACRALREHLFWEAARTLAPAVGDAAPGRGRARLAALTEAGALVEAVLALIGTATPGRSVRGMRFSAGRWTCTVDRATGARFSATHADLAAALLAAFIRSCAAVRRRRVARPHQPELRT